DPAQPDRCIQRLGMHVATSDMGRKDGYFGKRITVELAQGWVQDAGALQHLDDDGFQMFLGFSHKCTGLAQGCALMASRSNFMAWIKKQWKEKPRLAHAHVKPQAGPQKETQDSQFRAVSDPQGMLELYRGQRDKIWTERVYNATDFRHWRSQLLEDAHAQELPAITLDQVDGALKPMAPGKAPGIDVLGPRDVQRPPGIARRQLVDILNKAERGGAWPTAISRALGTAIPKEAGGCRVLGLLSLPFKLWSRIRTAPSTAWSEKQGALWDTEMTGSSALRAAFARAVVDECANELCIQHAALFLDLQKFYDSTCFVLLMQASRSLGYPATITVMEVTMYASPRMFKRSQCVDMANAFLHGILQKAHVVSLTTGLWTLIDDAVCRNEGVEMRVVGDMQMAAESLATSFQQARLTISDKTRLVVSSPGIGKELIFSLTAVGIPVKLTGSAVDYGVDVAGAKRRSQKKFRARLERAKLRSNRIHKLRRLHGRHKAAVAIVRQTALQATLGIDDPGVLLRRALNTEWIRLWLAQPAFHTRIKRAWSIVRAKLGDEVSWRGIRGDWSFPTVGNDAFKDAALGDFDELLAASSADVARTGWRKAAAHPRGETLTGGADLQLAQAELNSFAKN
ncbi:unnamed protein product, partial [Prorocentrum cordatum]